MCYFECIFLKLLKHNVDVTQSTFDKVSVLTVMYVHFSIARETSRAYVYLTQQLNFFCKTFELHICERWVANKYRNSHFVVSLWLVVSQWRSVLNCGIWALTISESWPFMEGLSPSYQLHRITELNK